ncbi:MAG: hypothetical protein LBD64_07080, partial [Odoribacteraceae bacterium]|nr:hypothetical protein [Odoribacteraceae bacterium]
VPEQWLNVPEQWPNVPGQLPNVPGQWLIVPGQWPNVPGQLLIVPGQWLIVPGQWLNVPGQWSIVPGQLPVVPVKIVVKSSPGAARCSLSRLQKTRFHLDARYARLSPRRVASRGRPASAWGARRAMPLPPGSRFNPLTLAG